MPASTEKKSLSNEQLAQAALAFIDEQGIDALSFRKLSERTDVPTMTIMNRFGSKDALQKAALAVMLDENKIEPVPGETWKENLRRVARINRAMALRHPNAFMLFVMVPPFESPVREYTEQIFALHKNENLPDGMPGRFLSLMHSYLTGFQLAETYCLQHQHDEDAASGKGDAAGESGALGGNGTLDVTAFEKDLFGEEAFERGLDVIIAGFQKEYGLE